MNKPFNFIVQENVLGCWVTLAKITCLEKAYAHIAELKLVAPEPNLGERYRVIREGEFNNY